MMAVLQRKGEAEMKGEEGIQHELHGMSPLYYFLRQQVLALAHQT